MILQLSNQKRLCKCGCGGNVPEHSRKLHKPHDYILGHDIPCECGWRPEKKRHLCHCGCGGMVYGYNRKLKRPHQFVHGHDQRGKKHPYVKSGKENPSYRGASVKTTRYYIRTQKPKPNWCERCGLLYSQIKPTRLPGRTKSKLLLCNVGKSANSKDPRDWQWLCHSCQAPKQHFRVKGGILSDHICECLDHCGQRTKYSIAGIPNRFVVGHNARGIMLPEKYIPGTPDDVKFRARMYSWAKLHVSKPKDGKCQQCHNEPVWKPYTISLKWLRNTTDWWWIGRECYRVAD